MEGPVSVVEDPGAPPESWEVADLDASMRRLMLSSASSKKDANSSSSSSSGAVASSLSNQSELRDSSATVSDLAGASGVSVSVASDDLVNSVDQFLREALQNPRERLSVLRMEQDIEKFIRDPTRQQMEFQQLPTSYLRLAAHRVAQHYMLQSMVLLDNSLPDSSASRIIVRKTAECRAPLIRLADIPVSLPNEDAGAVKVAIKQRPQKGSQIMSNSGPHAVKANSSKSVEERKEEYNRARARIFNSSSYSGGLNGKPENEMRAQDITHGLLGTSSVEERPISGGGPELNSGRGSVDPSAGSSRSARTRTEKEPIGRSKSSNRVAIFRDREIDRKDPDYDRSYDRYMQRFDPGFGFSGGPYTIQPMYAPAINYNTEFPQLGSAHHPTLAADHQTHPLPQHLAGPWAAPSTPGIGYGPPETMIPPFSPGHVGSRTNSALFLHATPYPCQRPSVPFIHAHDQVHQTFSQSHQQQPDASFGLARPR